MTDKTNPKKVKVVSIDIPIDIYTKYITTIKLYTNERVMGYNEKVFKRAVEQEIERLEREQEPLK
jgi:thiamine pyrophosphate-dependent acetolactate synthase large subunit-like protein